MNVDFALDDTNVSKRLKHIIDEWSVSSKRPAINRDRPASFDPNAVEVRIVPPTRVSQVWIPFTLLHRNYLKSYRDIVTYGIRIAMYMGLAIMMGTVWLQLQDGQEYIQPYINALVCPSTLVFVANV